FSPFIELSERFSTSKDFLPRLKTKDRCHTSGVITIAPKVRKWQYGSVGIGKIRFMQRRGQQLALGIIDLYMPWFFVDLYPSMHTAILMPTDYRLILPCRWVIWCFSTYQH